MSYISHSLRNQKWQHSASAAPAVTPLITQEQAKKRILQLEAAVCNNWHRSDFCSTHGWSVNENHTMQTADPISLVMSPRPLAMPLPVLERPSTRAGMNSCPVVLPIVPDVSGPLVLK